VINQTASTLDQKRRNLSNQPKIKPVHFLILFIIISTLIAFILGGYFLGKSKNEEEKRNASTNIEEQVSLELEELPGNPDNWALYSFEPLNLQIRIPDELNKKYEWTISELSSGNGKIICFSNEKLEKVDDCTGDILIIGTSTGSLNSDRDFSFVNSRGFSVANGALTIVGIGNEKYNLPDAKYKAFENNANFEIIKILGDESIGAPPSGYLGAIANTNNSDYPAIVFLMKIEGEVSEYEFDQILESLNSANP
jgi:hypothetical protein